MLLKNHLIQYPVHRLDSNHRTNPQDHRCLCQRRALYFLASLVAVQHNRQAKDMIEKKNHHFNFEIQSNFIEFFFSSFIHIIDILFLLSHVLSLGDFFVPNVDYHSLLIQNCHTRCFLHHIHYHCHHNHLKKKLLKCEIKEQINCIQFEREKIGVKSGNHLKYTYYEQKCLLHQMDHCLHRIRTHLRNDIHRQRVALVLH